MVDFHELAEKNEEIGDKHGKVHEHQMESMFKSCSNVMLRAWQWLHDSNKDNTPPDGWESYLLMMKDEDKRGIRNPIALAHIAGMMARTQDHNHYFTCQTCKKQSLQVFYCSPCPMCAAVDMYPKLPGLQQVVQCKHDDFIFTTTWDSCHFTLGLCLRCKEACVVDHQLKKDKDFYPETHVELESELL